MKLLSWNIRTPTNPNTKAEYVRHWDPDLCILSEYRMGEDGFRLRKQLKDIGYDQQIYSNHLPKEENGILIASKSPIHENPSPAPDAERPWRLLHFETLGLQICSVLLPWKKGDEKTSMWRALIDTSSRFDLLIGDFNSFPTRSDLTSSWLAPHRKSEFGYFQELFEGGFVDLWRHFHGDVNQYSYQGKNGKPYELRIDHALGRQKFLERVTRCYYDHDVRQQNISNHSSLLLELRSG